MSTPNASIPVLFEDNHLLAVVKPVNVPSQEDNTGDPDMLTLLKADLKERHNKPGNVFLGLVHRLDRPVGGAMVFAKTSKAASRLSETVRSRSMIKQYAAVVRGVPARPQGTLKDTLLKDSRTNTVAVVKPGTAGAKDAVLDYEVIASTGELSLVLIHLHTGRSHQIRVQMAHSGHPLYGDQKYGAEVNSKGEQLALWSVCTGVSHPVSKELMTFVSLPPRTRPWTQWNEAVYEQIRVQLGQ